MTNNLTIIKEKDKERTYEWESNHQIIRDCIMHYIDKFDKPPTITYIHETTRISWKTVRQHVAEGFDFGKATKKFKVLTEKVMMSVYNSAMKGNTASQRLFFELTEPGIFTENIVDVKPLSIQIKTLQMAETTEVK